VQEEVDARVVERAKRDRGAFGTIYDRYLPRVYAFALVQTGNREDAEDITAQTFERALKALPRYESRGAPFSSWLLRIAANLVIDRGRRGGRVVPLDDESLPESAMPDIASETPDGMVERWEEALWLRRQVDALPADQRRVVELRFWEDRSVREVAAQMGRSEGAIKQLLYRAVQSLRGRIGMEVLPDG